MENIEINNNKLQPIRDFVPIKKPQLKGNWTPTKHLIWDLYNRAAEAVKSFALLVDNQRYCDSFLVAGNALEACSVLSNIKDHDTEAGQMEAYNRYLAYSTVERLRAILNKSVDLEGIYNWETYSAVLKTFEPIGVSIASSVRKPEEKHQEAFRKLNIRAGRNLDKVKVLDEYYDPQITSVYLDSFGNKLENIGASELNIIYERYCNYKYNKILAGVLTDKIDRSDFNSFLDLMFEITNYLNTYKLDPNNN